MRKRRKKNYLKYSILILILILLIKTGYSYLSTSLNINGVISGTSQGYVIDTNSNSNLKMDLVSINTWTSNSINYYQYSINVTNISSNTISNFKLYLDFSNLINDINIWNYDYEINSNQLIVINNKKIKSNETVQVQFIISSLSTLKLNKIKFEITENLNEITDYDLQFQITNSWGEYYYQYNVTLTNKQSKRINAWRIEINLPDNTFYVSGWNALFTTESNKLIINNADYNGEILKNNSVSFGLQLNTNQVNFIPTDVRVFAR